MRSLRNKLVVALALAGAGFVAYRILLTPEARVSLGTAAKRVSSTINQVKDMADDHIGTYVDEDAEQNRRDVEADWARIGY